MKKSFPLFASLCLTAALLLSGTVSALGPGPDWSGALEETAAYLQQTVPDPQVSSVFGEWAVIGLARGGRLEPEQRDRYLQNLEEALREKEGVLSTRKYTEYARVSLALAALGADPRDMGGYDLLAPLADFDQTARQGLNGAVFALIALDCGGCEMDKALRARYLCHILDAQLADGGWALSGATADPDVTAQALQSLAPYRDSQQEAVSAGLARLTALWGEGAFPSCESYAQAIIALCALGEEVPDGLLTEFLSFRRPGGGFAHLPEGKADQMASEQALCALTALERADRGRSSLYDMGDAAPARSAGAPRQTLLTALLTAALVPAALLGLVR